jgi:hypothetical protein
LGKVGANEGADYYNDDAEIFKREPPVIQNSTNNFALPDQKLAFYFYRLK